MPIGGVLAREFADQNNGYGRHGAAAAAAVVVYGCGETRATTADGEKKSKPIIFAFEWNCFKSTPINL